MIKITSAQRAVIRGCHIWCDEHDKSTEFMIQYMCDHLQIQDRTISYEDAHDLVMEYLTEGKAT